MGATKWLRIASEKGNAYAQYNLGLCYYYGTGVRKSIRDTRELMKLSHKNGCKEAKVFWDNHQLGK